MITHITYHDGVYRIDGFPDVAPTYHQADLILQSIDEARHSAMIGGCELLIDAQAFAAAGREAWRIGPICTTCGDDGDCPDCGTYTNLDAIACPICGSPVHCDCDEDYVFVLRNTPLLSQCAASLRRAETAIQATLGGPVAGGGILDELRATLADVRRVRAALRKDGW